MSNVRFGRDGSRWSGWTSLIRSFCV